MKSMLLAAVVAGTVVAGSIIYLRKKKEPNVKKTIGDSAALEAIPSRSQYAMG